MTHSLVALPVRGGHGTQQRARKAVTTVDSLTVAVQAPQGWACGMSAHQVRIGACQLSFTGSWRAAGAGRDGQSPGHRLSRCHPALPISLASRTVFSISGDSAILELK